MKRFWLSERLVVYQMMRDLLCWLRWKRQHKTGSDQHRKSPSYMSACTETANLEHSLAPALLSDLLKRGAGKKNGTSLKCENPSDISPQTAQAQGVKSARFGPRLLSDSPACEMNNTGACQLRLSRLF
ncbi:hypothetical protein BaRGS_00039061 [Batillaria attramentaria]|uniref:Uncharacterized protein n=1 Tax=Batillaria attramentaria TaxID=370345 RepID=A0ABD0J420_9CAEN